MTKNRQWPKMSDQICVVIKTGIYVIPPVCLVPETVRNDKTWLFFTGIQMVCDVTAYIQWPYFCCVLSLSVIFIV